MNPGSSLRLSYVIFASQRLRPGQALIRVDLQQRLFFAANRGHETASNLARELDLHHL